MGEDDNKKCLRVFLYIFNSLLIVKGILYGIYIIVFFFFVFAIASAFGRKRRAAPGDLPPLLGLVSYIIFGVAALVFGIIGIVATAKRHSPTLLTNAVLLMLLFLAEVAIHVVFGVYGVYGPGSLVVTNLLLWIGVLSAILTLVTCSLTFAFYAYIRKTRYV